MCGSHVDTMRLLHTTTIMCYAPSDLTKAMYMLPLALPENAHY